MNNYILYALTDHKDNIRYIGYTSNKPNNRLKEHINSSFNSREKNCHRCKWIRSLINNNKKPLIKELIRVDSLEKAKLLEIELIKHYKQFVKLTNNTNGGDGTKGLKWSEESKNNIKGRKIPGSGIKKNIEILNIETGDYKIVTKEEAINIIGCKMSTLKGHHNRSVFGWYINTYNK